MNPVFLHPDHEPCTDCSGVTGVCGDAGLEMLQMTSSLPCVMDIYSMRYCFMRWDGIVA